MSPPGADSADPQVTRRSRNFVLCGPMDLPLGLVDAGSCARLHAQP